MLLPAGSISGYAVVYVNGQRVGMSIETHGYGTELQVPFDKGPHPAYRPEWKAVICDRINLLVERDKNYPSVIL